MNINTPHLMRIAAIVTSLLGLYLFKQGFLLTRTSLYPLKSTCDSPPYPWPNHTPTSTQCWAPPPFKTLKRSVVLLVDALRWDFATPQHPHMSSNPYFQNHLPVLSHTPGSILLRANVDPPTTTFQRLKALVTGTLPTFIEMSNNFGVGDVGNDLVYEDSILSQIRDRATLGSGFGTTMMGDDTWLLLFRHLLNKTYPYPSLDVFDLDTVDNGCLAHLFDELKSNSWDLLVSHFLGVDHAGHRYGPTHSAMTNKLAQLNTVIEDVKTNLPDDCLLIVVGDHGMDPKGDHGGDSKLETSATLWFYANGNLLTSTRPSDQLTHAQVNQIDLVPTLSLMMGLPIPFENLGSIIPHMFADPEYLLHAQQLNAAQVKTFLDAYKRISPNELDDSHVLNLPDPISQPTRFLNNALALCRSVWARFHLVYMGLGITLMVISLLLLIPDITLSFSSNLAAHGVLILPLVSACLVYSDNGIIYEDMFSHVLLSILVFVHTLFVQLNSYRWWGWVSLVLIQITYRIHVCRPENHHCVNTYTNNPWTAALGMLMFLGWAVGRPVGRWYRVVLSGLVLLSLILEEEWIQIDLMINTRSVSVYIVRAQLTLMILAYIKNKITLNTLLILLVSQFSRMAGLSGLITATVVLQSFEIPLLQGNQTTHKPILATLCYVILVSMQIRTTLFATGHQATVNSIQWNIGHVGLQSTHYLLSPLAILINTLGHVLILLLQSPMTSSSSSGLGYSVVGLELFNLVHSTIAVTILKRHLMVWGVFAPRWMLASLIYLFVVTVFFVRFGVVAIKSAFGNILNKHQLL